MQDGKYIKIGPIADSIPLDNTTIDCIENAETVQEGFEELCEITANSASTSYQFGREGAHNNNTWLIGAETVSSRRGLPFGLDNGKINKVTLSNKNIPSIFSVEVWHHLGNLSSASLIGTVTTAGTGSTEDFVVDWSVPKGVQLAVKIKTTGATKPSETGVFLVVKGDLN